MDYKETFLMEINRALTFAVSRYMAKGLSEEAAVKKALNNKTIMHMADVFNEDFGLIKFDDRTMTLGPYEYGAYSALSNYETLQEIIGQ